MKIKITVLTLCALLFALCGSAEAQQPTNPCRLPPCKSHFPLSLSA